MERAMITDTLPVNRDGMAPKLFRLVGGVARDAILISDAKGFIVYWNPAAERVFGYGVEEVIGEPLTLLLPDRYRDAYREWVAHYHATGEGILPGRTMELSGQRKSGVEFPMELTVAAMDVGESTMFAAVVRDVSERVRSEQELSRGEQTFCALVDGVVDHAIFRLSPLGKIETWNTGASRILGYGEDEIVGRPLASFYPPEDVKAEKPRRALETAERFGHFEDEGWRVRKDGGRFWANDVITALRDSTGALIGFAKVTRDLTERRRAAMELRQSEQRYRLLVENNPDRAIYQVSRDGVIETWNLGGENIHGYASGDIVGQPSSVLYVAEEVRAGRPQRNLQEAEEVGRCEEEGWRLRKDGSRFWASTSISALRDPSGAVYGYATVTRDRTARREAEETAKRLGEEHVSRTVAEQGQKQARELAQRIQILEESASQFAAAPGNLEDTLATIAKRCAEVLGDGCIIELLTPDGRELDVRAFHHTDARARNLGQTKLLGKRVAKAGLGKLAMDSKSAVLKVATDHREIAAAAGQAIATCFESIPIHSLAAVPLMADGAVVGVIEVTRHSPDRPYLTNNVTLLQDLADRAGTAVARARMFEAESTARDQAERSALRMTRLQAATAALAEAKSPGDAASATLLHGVELFGMSDGAVFRVAENGESVSLLASLGDADEVSSVATASPENEHPALACVRRGESIFIESAEQLAEMLPDVRPIPFLARARSAMLLPARVQGAVRGVIVMASSARAQEFSKDSRRLAESFVQQCALAIDRTELAEIERRTAEHSAILAEASSIFSSSLDPVEVLDRLAKMVVPRLGDWCAIEMREGDTSRQVTIAHTDPERTRWASAFGTKHHFDRTVPSGPWHVIQTGEPELFDEIPDALLAGIAQDEEHLGVLRALGLGSGMVVPLIARGVPIGALTLIAERIHRYDRSDMAFAEELAHRAALAVDNARLYRDLAQAVQARDDFLSVAGHELKTPLATMLVRLDILARAAKRSTIGVRVVEQVWRAQAAGQRLELLIDELLDVARIGVGRLKLNVEHVDLAKLLREVIDGLTESAAKVECKLSVKAPEALIGDWDRLRVEGVVANLLRNAFKYGAGKPVEVELRADRLDAILRVTDHGVGIPVERQDAIFERFGRPADAREFGGLGLGLWLSRQVVEASGGSIGVQSTAGEGATFTVRLPMM